VFTESLLESNVHSRRGWTTALSFGAQSLAVGALLALPFLYTQALPKMVALGAQIGPPPGEPPRAEVEQSRNTATNSASEIVGNTVRIPIHIPSRAAEIHDSGPLQAQPNLGPYIPGSIGSGLSNGWPTSLLPVPHVAYLPHPQPTTRRYTVSGGVSQGLLTHQVKPTYPPLAIASRTQGTVVLAAVISKSGEIENLRVVSGHPLLVRAAAEAVQQWRYRPYLLNGEPVEIETQITVNFTLGNN